VSPLRGKKTQSRPRVTEIPTNALRVADAVRNYGFNTEQRLCYLFNIADSFAFHLLLYRMLSFHFRYMGKSHSLSGEPVKYIYGVMYDIQ